MKLKLITRVTAFLSLLGVAVLCILLYVMAGTTRGSHWLLQYLDNLSDGWNISAQNISGSLLYGLTLNRLMVISSETVSADIDMLHIKWHPQSLLRGVVNISPFKAEGIRIAVMPSGKAPAEQEPVNLRFPVGIILENVQLQDITIETKESTLHLPKMKLEKGSLGRILKVGQLSLIAETYSFTITKGRISAEPPYKSDFEISWQFLQAGNTAAEGRAKLIGDIGSLAIEHRLTSPVDVESLGVFHSGLLTRQTPHLTLENKISNGQWTYGQEQLVRIPSATIKLQGWLDEYSLQVNGSLNAADFPETAITLVSNGDLEGLQVNALTIRGLNGDLNGAGKLSWQPGVTWDLQLQAQHINPGAHWKSWPGKIDMNGAIKGEYSSNTLNTHLRVDSLTGTLRNYPLQASGDITLKDGQWSGQDLQLKLGENRIKVSGSIGNTFSAQWNIRAPDLTALWPALNGQLFGEGQLKGTPSRLNLTGKLHAEKLEYQNYRIGLINLSAVSSSDYGQSSSGFEHSIQASANNLDIDGFFINDLRSKLNGSLDNHKILTTLSTRHGILDLQLSGHWQASRWQATLQQADINATATGAWLLQSPSSVVVSSGILALTKTCWQQNHAEACLSGRLDNNEINVNSNLKAIPLGLTKPWLPNNMEISGQLEGRLEATGSLKEPTGILVLQPGDGHFLVKQVDADPDIYAWRNAHLRMDFADGSYNLTAGLQLQDQGEASASLKLGSQKHLGGTINLHFSQLAWLEAWTPHLRNIQGVFDAELRLAGTLEQPQWLGEAKLREAAATIPSLGIDLNGITTTLTGIGKNHLMIKGSTESGPGQISFEGQLDKPPSQPWQLRLNIQGNRFEVMSTPEAHVLATPVLRLSASKKLIHVEGSIELPEVDIQLKTLPNRAVKVSEDVVIINEVETDAERATGIPIKTNIKLKLGEQVHFQGFGFEAHLSGILELIEEPNQPTLAYGVLTIDKGRYKAYGQNLLVEKGKLIFQGPYDNPGLDIRATRKARDVTVGLDIGGTLKNINSTVFSEPALPDSEAIAILLTGKPLSNTTESDANLLVNAIASLGIKKSQPVTNQLSETFGLDVLTIDSESGGLEQSSLMIGKYLTPRLYVRYAIGLFDQISKLALEYQLTEHIMVEAKSGKNQSMDIIYRIER